MAAKSGVWLEGFSKRDAQAMLNVLPWAVVCGSILFHTTLLVLELMMSELWELVQGIERAVHCILALLCAAYIPIAILCERSCCCCRAEGPKRTLEGWLALLSLALCAACEIAYVQEDRRSHSEQLVIIHGSMWFRVASTVQFLLQLLWLFAADRLHYAGKSLPKLKCYMYLGLPLLWCLTLWGPVHVYEKPKTIEDALVLIGYSARLMVFILCAANACRSCTGHCHCCCSCLLSDQQDLEILQCTPGKQRLRCLTYYILMRPPFLVIVNLPVGYPLAFFAAFASTIRCGFALLLALSLRPAPHDVMCEHEIEADTRESFNLAVALRLWDFSNETYYGTPPPPAVVVRGATWATLNGEYLLDCHEPGAAPVYSRLLSSTNTCSENRDAALPVDATTDAPQQRVVKAFLRQTPQAEWELSGSSTVKSGVRWAYVKDRAVNPHEISGLWFEISEGTIVSNPNMHISSSTPSLRRFQMHGECKEIDSHWLLVEEDSALASKIPVDRNSLAAGSLDRVAPNEVSIIIGFRGTSSVQNMITDARISLQPLVYQSASVLNSDDEATPDESGSHQGTSVVTDVGTAFDIKGQVAAILRNRSTEIEISASEVDEGDRVDTRDVRLAPRQECSSPGMCCKFCRLIGRCFILMCFPFLPPSDHEDDDEDFTAETLERVRVHVGFSTSYTSIRQHVMNLLRQRLNKCEEERRTAHVYITGHSLGGAIATLFALDVASGALSSGAGGIAQPVTPIVYTFGSPRLGNAAFRSIYNTLVPNTFRIVCSKDLVPTLPPSISYRQVGREVWFDDAGEITYVMSWAMRHILPARDSLKDHRLLAYLRVLNLACQKAMGRKFVPSFQRQGGAKDALLSSHWPECSGLSEQ